MNRTLLKNKLKNKRHEDIPQVKMVNPNEFIQKQVI